MNTLLLCTAVLILMYAGLSFNVSRVRLKRRRFPETPEAELNKAVRAHGNASEYLPLFALLFLYFNLTGPGLAAVALAIVATISRVAHCAGMFSVSDATQRHPLRFWGALGTYICLAGFGVLILIQAF